MKKLGFTIVELLVILGVLGVISALTLPTLATAHQNRINSTALSVAVSNMETALRTMIEAENANDLTDTRAWTASNNLGNMITFKGHLGEYIELSNTVSVNDYYSGITIQATSGVAAETASGLIFGADNALITPAGGIYVFRRIENDRSVPKQQAIHDNMNLHTAVANLIIDVNGTKNPNTVGRDIFYFIVGSDGVLYPYGSKDVEYILSNGSNTDLNWNSAGARYTCTDNAKSNDGMGCTARLIDNGYKMDY